MLVAVINQSLICVISLIRHIYVSCFLWLANNTYLQAWYTCLGPTNYAVCSFWSLYWDYTTIAPSPWVPPTKIWRRFNAASGSFVTPLLFKKKNRHGYHQPDASFTVHPVQGALQRFPDSQVCAAAVPDCVTSKWNKVLIWWSKRLNLMLTSTLWWLVLLSAPFSCFHFRCRLWSLMRLYLQVY